MKAAFNSLGQFWTVSFLGLHSTDTIPLTSSYFYDTHNHLELKELVWPTRWSDIAIFYLYSCILTFRHITYITTTKIKNKIIASFLTDIVILIYSIHSTKWNCYFFYWYFYWQQSKESWQTRIWRYVEEVVLILHAF